MVKRALTGELEVPVKTNEASIVFMSAPTLLYSTSLLGFLPYGQVLSRVTGHWHSRPLVAYSFNYNTSLLLLIFLLLHHMYTYIQIKHQSRSRETDFTTKL